MGFRTTLTTEAFLIEVPQWFKDKYDYFNYGKSRYLPDKDIFPISLKFEVKFYSKLNEDERILDIQKLLRETGINSLSIVLLHECGGITLVKVTKDTITAKEPETWREVEHVEHNYCYGCSD